MKILFLTPWYPDEKVKNHGVFVREQASAIASVHEVVVISSKVDYSKFAFSSYEVKQSVYGAVKEYRLVIKRSLPLYNQFNYFRISRKVALEVARSFKPDIIHGNIGYPGAFWSWLVSKKIHKPYVVTEHTFIYNNFRSFWHRQATLFSLTRASAVIAVSTKLATEILKHCKANVQVIPNIVEISRFSIQPFPNSKVSIGFMGGLSSHAHVKGLDVLIRVISKIDKDFVLHIGGDGVLRAEYEKMASQLGVSGRCRFHGFVDYVDVPQFMNQLHFFVNASRFESFGIAIVEAMASGVPVVCFDNGGPSDFVNESNGILVENQNEEKLKEAIEWMIMNYHKYDRDHIRHSAETFSSMSFLNKIDYLYSSVLNSEG